MEQLNLVTRQDAEAQDRLDGLLYNACYMLEFQVRRCQRGTWDAFSERLLRAGIQTARRVIQHGKAYGRFDKPVLLRLIVEAEKLLKPRYVAIVGSRKWPYPDAVRAYVAKLPANTIVVSGGAAGVDSWAEQAARQRGLDVKVFPADWNTYGKSAGFRRNADIVNACDELTAFWDGVSRGTAHSVELARKAGKPVTVITPEMCKESEAA